VIIAAALAGVIVPEFGRRQSLQRVHAVLVAEQLMATPHG